jgi:antitoxin component of RelBE/YafQ-DinJ toxin-antitoxin module
VDSESLLWEYVAKGDEAVRVYMPPEKKRAFKASCSAKGMEMSEVVNILIDRWLKENPSPSSQQTTTVQSIAELVKTHYFELSEQEVPNIAAITKGGEPLKADILRIAKALSLDYQEVLAIALRSFPDSAQLRSTYKLGAIELDEDEDKEPNGVT